MSAASASAAASFRAMGAGRTVGDRAVAIYGATLLSRIQRNPATALRRRVERHEPAALIPAVWNAEINRIARLTRETRLTRRAHHQRPGRLCIGITAACLALLQDNTSATRGVLARIRHRDSGVARDRRDATAQLHIAGLSARALGVVGNVVTTSAVVRTVIGRAADGVSAGAVFAAHLDVQSAGDLVEIRAGCPN